MNPSAFASQKSIPLCVDLDGTLIHSDTLWENIVFILREKPARLPFMLFWLLKGRAAFKKAVAEESHINCSLLPWRKNLVEWLKQQKKEGRKIYLVTASDKKTAENVAKYLNIFDEVIASDGRQNLKSGKKAALLLKHFGNEGFDYVGDSIADIPVWKIARHGICVTQKKSLLRARGLQDKVHIDFTSSFRFATLLSALRIHQWAKNILVFLPLLASHNWNNGELLWSSFCSALGLCFLASAVYLFNDLIDLEADRKNRQKYKRPLASGELTIPSAFILGISGLIVSFLCILPIPYHSSDVAVLYGFYLIGNFLYSFEIKRVAALDILFLTGFYLIRVWIGGVATGIPISVWLLGFTMFIFTSLALLKRYTEASGYVTDAHEMESGRGYVRSDAPFLLSWGVASGTCSLLVLVPYVCSRDVALLYHKPFTLLFLCPIFFFWLMRLWLIGARGKMHEDPVAFALTDRQTYIMAIISIIVIIQAK